MKRRTFIQTLAASISSMQSMASMQSMPSILKPTSTVIRAKDDKVRLKLEQFDPARLAAMLDGAVMKLTNTTGAAAGWKALFSPKDVVGLKVNCLAGPRLSSHPALVDQIVRGLRLAGVPDGNIHVWERSNRELQRAGFRTTSPQGNDLHCVGIDGAYDEEIVTSGKVGSRWAPQVSRLCTAQINVPVLKDHRICGLGCGMKNFFGAINNPNKYHENGCDPYVADVCALPQIRDRLRLIVCDALNGQYEGGPSLRPGMLWEENALLAGRDPVALDAVALSMIEQRRAAASLPSLEKDGRAPTWLATANKYGLGEIDLKKIELVNL